LYEQEPSQSSLSLRSDSQSSLDTASPSPPLLSSDAQQQHQHQQQQQRQQQQQHASSHLSAQSQQCIALPSAGSSAAKSSAAAASTAADAGIETKRPGSPEKRPGSPDKGPLTARSSKKRDSCKDTTTATAMTNKDAVKSRSGQQQQPAKFQFRQDAVRKPQLSAESWIPMDLRMKVSF
jgi:hypothetical protein